ncbi:MAG TPA: hypothetical protein VJU77_19825 [Chthoniobacterales bacterium]|nr:hypothetical protein [Chthoniobacterales bacterium]
MDHWLDPDACEQATWDFCKKMRDNPAERERCRTDHAYARESFAKDRFYLEENRDRDTAFAPIPTDVEFRVFNEDDKEKRQKLVVIVLPDDRMELPMPARMIKPAEAIFKGAWFPYAK